MAARSSLPKLGQILVRNGWIEPEVVRRALNTQGALGDRLGTCLLESGSIGEDLLLKALSEQHGLPAAGVEDLREVPEEVIAALPAKLALSSKAVPFRAFGTQTHVAILDPRDLESLDQVAFALGKRIQPYVATEPRLLQALARYYGGGLLPHMAQLLERLDRARYRTPRRSATGTAPRGTRSVWDEPESALFGRAAGAAASSLPPGRQVSPSAVPAATSNPAPEATGTAILTATRPAPARSPAVQRRTSITLSAEERAALVGEVARDENEAATDDTRPVPIDAPALPLSIASAEAYLASCTRPDEVADILLGFLGQRFSRVALFQVLRDQVLGWRSTGAHIDAACLARYAVTFDEPSAFLNLRKAGSFFLGRLAPMPAHHRLATCFGDRLPAESLLLPVRIRGRLVTVAYADRGPDGMGSVELEPLVRLAAAAADAYERCILRRKKD